MTAPAPMIQPRGGVRLLQAAAHLHDVPPEQAAEYRTLCLQLPALLRKSGLSETMAFLESTDVGKSVAANLGAILGQPQLAQLAQSQRDVERYLELSAEALEIAEVFALIAWEPDEIATPPRGLP